MDSMELHSRPGKSRESGFTLAGVIVIMTIMMIVVAYTVPRMWSTVMKRERERQTIYVMQQYAKAIAEFQDKTKAYPTSPQQLKDARSEERRVGKECRARGRPRHENETQ